jgi:DNA-binding protein H-NS
MGTQMFVELILPTVVVGVGVIIALAVVFRLAAEKLRVLSAERKAHEEAARKAAVMTNEREEALAAVTQAVTDLMLEIGQHPASYSVVPTELMEQVLRADAQLSRSLR